MHILAINSNIDTALRHLGHTVHSVRIAQGGVYSAQKLVDERSIAPDIFFQQENLGSAILFYDVHTLGCLKIFWSIDTHLNYYWQRYYGELFDVFCTPHKAYLEHLAQDWQPKQLYRLSPCGYERPVYEHCSRNDIAFVGRVTKERPLRQNFCAFLQNRFGVKAQDNMPLEAMLSVYDTTRILPNESIAFETNFRSMEGASCGCCVISPHIGADQDTLFIPNEEIHTYNDMLEFIDIMQFCLNNPHHTQKIGHAAQQRVLREHLPIHRAKYLCYLANTATSTALHGKEGDDTFFMTLCLMYLSNAVHIQNALSFFRHTFVSPVASCQARMLLALTQNNTKEIHDTLTLAHALCRSEHHTHDRWILPLCITSGGAALYVKNTTLSADFYAYATAYRHDMPAIQDSSDAIAAGSAWTKLLIEDKKILCHGQSMLGCCHSVLDMIQLLAHIDQFHTAWAEHFLQSAHLAHILPHFTLAAQARISLNTSTDITASCNYIATALRFFAPEKVRDEITTMLAHHPTPRQKAAIDKLLHTRFPKLHLLTPLLGQNL